MGSGSAELIVDSWQWRLECRRYLGDAFPSIWPNFGPGVMAAFLGCDLKAGVEADTTWFSPRENRKLSELSLVTDETNRWYQRVREIVRLADERFHGAVQIGLTDLGGNLDLLSSFRPGESLLLDLCDDPEEVERLTWEAHSSWWDYFEQFRRATPHNPEHSAWTPIFSETPSYILQCGFSHMIGPHMFDRFVRPELVASCRKLGNAVYHLDGPGQRRN